MKAFFWNFWTIKILTQGSIEMILKMNMSFSGVKLWIEILVGEITPVVTENLDFHQRDKSKILTFSGIF